MRQRHPAIEFAVGPLTAIVAFTLFIVFVLALAFDRNAVVGDLDVNVILGQAREVGAHYNVFAALKHFNLR
jgi:hypothetical protein